MGLLFGTVLTVLAIFLILLVLVQRGRGGGLSGALGGMGGSSAFGAKAGDVFTRITIVTAAIWICVCAAAVYWANNKGDRLGSLPARPLGQSAPAGTDSGAGPAGNAAKSDATKADASSTEPAAPAAESPAPPADSKAPASDAPATPDAPQ
ncbi:MAG: preprotein translocase subunit SecG [Pirellulales bacterium]